MQKFIYFLFPFAFNVQNNIRSNKIIYVLPIYFMETDKFSFIVSFEISAYKLILVVILFVGISRAGSP